MDMHNPPHPGLTIREDVLPALGLSVNEAAQQLNITRQSLSAVINGRSGITVEMALKLEAWLGVERGGRAEVWLSQQNAFDLVLARKARRAAIRRVKPAMLAHDDVSLAIA